MKFVQNNNMITLIDPVKYCWASLQQILIDYKCMSKWRVASYKLGNESEKALQLKLTVSIQSNNNASHKPDQYKHWDRNKELEPSWK